MSYKTTRLAVSPAPTVYYALDEAVGTSAADSAGNNNVGTASTGGVLGGATGIPADGAGTAALFTGAEEIDLSVVAGFPTGDHHYTVDIWFFTTSTDDPKTLYAQGDVNTPGATALFRLEHGALALSYEAFGSDLLAPDGPDLRGAWHYGAITYDGTTRRIYLDGVQVQADVPGIPGILTTDTPAIGAIAGNGQNWVGRLKHLAITDGAALPAATLLSLYQAGAGAVRTVVVQNTDLGVNNTPATGSTAITLLSPDNVTPVHTLTGKALTILSFDPPLDGTGLWSEALIPTGDMTPAGCVYQFTEPGGQVTNLAFAYADGPTITLSDHYPTQNIVGQIKVYLAGLEINGLVDTTLPLTAAISADAAWVGGVGVGQLISSNNPIAFAPDGQGNASVYMVRQSQLSTGASSNPYLIVNTRSGTPIAFLAPDTYDDALLGYVDRGVYAGGTTYAAKDVVRDPVTDVPYSSIAGGNVGHSPASSPGFWLPHPGVRITAHSVLPGSSVSPVATESMIATLTIAAIHHAIPTTVQEHFEEQAFQLAILRMAGTHGRQTLSPLRVLI